MFAIPVIKVCLIGGGNNKKKWLNSIVGGKDKNCHIGCEVHPYLYEAGDLSLNFWSIENMEDGLVDGYIDNVDYYIVFDQEHVKYTKGTKYILWDSKESRKFVPLWAIYSDQYPCIRKQVVID